MVIEELFLLFMVTEDDLLLFMVIQVEDLLPFMVIEDLFLLFMVTEDNLLLFMVTDWEPSTFYSWESYRGFAFKDGDLEQEYCKCLTLALGGCFMMMAGRLREAFIFGFRWISPATAISCISWARRWCCILMRLCVCVVCVSMWCVWCVSVWCVKVKACRYVNVDQNSQVIVLLCF